MTNRIVAFWKMRALVGLAAALSVLSVGTGRAIGVEYDLDTTGITTAPAARLPTTRITRRAFEQANVVRTLAGPNERLVAPKTAGTRTSATSENFHIERDAANGAILVSRRDQKLIAGRLCAR